MRKNLNYKGIALSRLKGNWGRALLASLVVALLAGTSVNGTAAGAAIDTYTSWLNISNYAPIASPIGSYLNPVLNFINNLLPKPLILSVLPRMFLVSILVSLAWTLISAAVALGHHRYYIGLVIGETPKFHTLFSRFHILLKACGLLLYITLLMLVWYLPTVVATILSTTVFAGLTQAVWMAAWGILIGLLRVASLIFVIIAGMRYSMASCLMAQYPHKGIRECVRDSATLMRGKKGKLFGLRLSFLGWGLLAILTAGIGLLWLTPYMNAANAAFYLDITGQWPKEPDGEDAAPLEPDLQQA
ncbi:MAG: DUF975 family protein [Christensenellaceae bacterium]|jgi:uncharacterized membrane protein|nr:DUF975 family protein [Christensenellaceae bacterium]